MWGVGLFMIVSLNCSFYTLISHLIIVLLRFIHHQNLIIIYNSESLPFPLFKKNKTNISLCAIILVLLCILQSYNYQSDNSVRIERGDQSLHVFHPLQGKAQSVLTFFTQYATRAG